MSYSRTCFCLAALLFSFGPVLYAGDLSMLHTSNGQVVNKAGEPVLLKGVGLSPWLDPQPYLIVPGLRPLLQSPAEFKQKLTDLVGSTVADNFWEDWAANFVTEEDFRRLKEQGFNCVRLPVNYKYVLNFDDQGHVSYNQAGIAPVDHAVEWGDKYGIYVILDLHYMPGGQNSLAGQSDLLPGEKIQQLWTGPNARQNQERAVQIWQVIAARYAGRPSVGGYDLINEPHLPSSVPKTDLAHLYTEMIQGIRSVDSAHMVILEGDAFAHDFSALTPPLDQNMMYEFHEYSIFNPKWKTPNPEALQPFLDLRASTQIPLWLGEFGEESPLWQKQMVQLMKTNQIGWSVWPWKRIELGNSHPVLETIDLPLSWKKLGNYLVGGLFNKKPGPADAKQALDDMLQAIQTAHCREDPDLIGILTGESK